MRALALAVALSACATAPSTPLDPMEAHGAALAGSWSNATQWRDAPEELRRSPAAGHPYDWVDYQEATFYRVEAPSIGAHVIYLEWRGEDGAISRQRLWSFRRDASNAVRMDFFTLRMAEAFAGRGAEAAAFVGVRPEDLIGYGEACALYVVPEGDDGGFVAEIPPDCRITSRSGRVMTLTAGVYVDGSALGYQEAGVLEDGSYAFKVPGGPPYLFLRTP